MAKIKRVIMWFRQDLRLHDNEALTEAFWRAEEVIPIYVFDPRAFQDFTITGFRKIGYHRAKFIIEAILDLRKNLQKLGSDLIVRAGLPECEIFNITKELDASYVFCNRERTRDEVKVQDALEQNLWLCGKEISFFRGKMLLHTADLPFPVSHCPDQFNNFKKEVEKIVPIRSPFAVPRPKDIRWNINIERGEVPSIKEFFPNANGQFKSLIDGGESAALARLEKLNSLINEDGFNSQDDNPFPLIGRNSLLSPYFAQGCLSPKEVYKQIIKPNKSDTEHPSNQLFLDLLYRDFLRFVTKKYGGKLFKEQETGTKPIKSKSADEMKLLRLWCDGHTGIPIVDACMKQLNTCGFVSHKGRQICASFLIHELNLNWQMGAEYFESKLIDYDPCSNWGNWMNMAGVGPYAKMDIHINPIAQAKKLDPQGHFVKQWIPELEKIPQKFIHQPYLYKEDPESNGYFVLERDYPKPILTLN